MFFEYSTKNKIYKKNNNTVSFIIFGTLIDKQQDQETKENILKKKQKNILHIKKFISLPRINN
ncbi:hypothetical protein DMB65_17805 [Flavobacterium cheongpyeongense]|uniref:Uncharacterized protein n=1 Tax=Flavobacterium cheongpyeongense TaxID=2212651 RepID=A0A2V4BKH2_9FLAO|nr:hypothetical protein DMB65_17805 [Flavobacterium cheongpyeongense]